MPGDANAVIVYIAIAVGAFILLFVFFSRRSETVSTHPGGARPSRTSLFTPKYKKAMYAYADTRGLTVLPEDSDGSLTRRFVEEMHLPVRGDLQNIMKIPLSLGEGYLFTQNTEATDINNTEAGTPRQSLVAFFPLAVSGRTFLTPKFPLGGTVGKKMNGMLLSHLFGVQDVSFIETEREFPEFSKKLNLFSEDEDGARRVILNTEITSLLIELQGKMVVNMTVTPGGLAMHIEPMIRKPELIEELTSWLERMIQALSER